MHTFVSSLTAIFASGHLVLCSQLPAMLISEWHVHMCFGSALSTTELTSTTCDAGKQDPMSHNANQPPGGMYFVNIFLHPFNFSKPEFFIRDGATWDNKTIGVWKLPALGLGDGSFFDISEHDWALATDNLVYTKDMVPDPR